jgi:fructan beta-fructosidase
VGVEYREPFRPQFHFSPRRNWTNDPNGPFYLDGEYHLFFQYNPHVNDWGHMSWGHAVSRDLLHWEQRDVAIPEHDTTMIFSGNCVVDQHDTSGLGGGAPCAVALYTGHTTDPATGNVNQTQNIAYSRDNGRTWTRYAANPIIDIGKPNFRDPQVIWHAPTARWVMSLALPDERQVRFYASYNLIDWQFLSDFGPLGASDGIWECPVLLHLPVDGNPDERRWLLKISVNDVHPAGGSGDQYVVGDFDGRSFTPIDTHALPLWVDHGADFYSAMAWFDAPSDHGEQTWIAWMSNWRYARSVPTSPWRGAMTLPRTVELASTPRGLRLIQQPVPALNALRGQQQSWSALDAASLNTQLAAATPNITTCELRLTLDLGTVTQAELHLGAVIVGYDRTSSKLYVDRSGANHLPFESSFPARHSAPLTLDVGTLTLRIFLDTSSIEVATERGDTWLTDLLFAPPDATSIELVTTGGSLARVSLDYWPLASIWR